MSVKEKEEEKICTCKKLEAEKRIQETKAKTKNNQKKKSKNIITKKNLTQKQSETENVTKTRPKKFDIPEIYHHFGFASTESKLRVLIQKRFCDIAHFDEIGFYQIVVADNYIKDSCKPYKCVFAKPAHEKISVFFKHCECDLHAFTIVFIIAHSYVKDNYLKELNQLKANLFHQIIPKVQFDERSSTHNLVKGVPCGCNKDEEGGGTRSFGCGACPVNPHCCKFFQKPAEGKPGRLKFDLEKDPKNKVDNSTVKDFCVKVCDLASDFMEIVAPDCYKNMAVFSSEAASCRIGSKAVNIFAGVTIVSDYTAHPHIDHRDFPLGAAVVLSIRQNQQNLEKADESERQLHYLPMYKFSHGVEPGIGFYLGHGSFLLENAAQETHGTSTVKNASCREPKRVGIVCFTHNGLNKADHGSHS